MEKNFDYSSLFLIEDFIDENKSPFERLPKSILCKIILELNTIDFLNVWTLNKNLLRIFCESSPHISNFWIHFGMIKEDEKKIDHDLESIKEKSFLDQKMNKYALYTKVI